MTTTPTHSQTQTKARINPRIRERRIEVQREAGRKRLRVLLVVSSVLSAFGLAFLVVTSPVLDVDHIPVAGAQHITPAQVRTAAGVRTHDHLLFVDTGAIARRVEQIPWVEHASVQRDFPGTLKITVTEYTPAAFVRVATGGVVLVAANGHVIAHAPAAPAQTVEVRGVRQAPGVGQLLSPPDAAGIVVAAAGSARTTGRGDRRERERGRARPRERPPDPARVDCRSRRQGRVGAGGAGASRSRVLHLHRCVDAESAALTRMLTRANTHDGALHSLIQRPRSGTVSTRSTG